MDWIVNTRLLSNPLNWLSIGAMLLLVVFAAIAIYSHFIASTMDADNSAAVLAKES